MAHVRARTLARRVGRMMSDRLRIARDAHRAGRVSDRNTRNEVSHESRALYETALKRLAPHDRDAIVARLEMRYSYDELVLVLRQPSAPAARAAVIGALQRLAKEMQDAAS